MLATARVVRALGSIGREDIDVSQYFFYIRMKKDGEVEACYIPGSALLAIRTCDNDLSMSVNTDPDSGTEFRLSRNVNLQATPWEDLGDENALEMGDLIMWAVRGLVQVAEEELGK